MKIIYLKNNEATITLTSNAIITVSGENSSLSNGNNYTDIILSVNVFDFFYSSSNNGYWIIKNDDMVCQILKNTGQIKSPNIPLLTCNSTLTCNLINSNDGILTIRFKKNLPSNSLIDINLLVTESDEILGTTEKNYILKDSTIENIDFINSLNYDEKIVILQDGILKQCDYPLVLDHQNVINLITTVSNEPLLYESGKYMVQNITLKEITSINNLNSILIIQNNVLKICNLEILRTELNS